MPNAWNPMRTKFFGVGFLLSLTGVCFAGSTATNHASQDGRVSVAFVHPETFADAGPRGADREREGILRELGAAMQRSAADYLREDVSLEVRVTNLDLAGQIEDWRGLQFRDLRSMRSVYPPRMTVEYRLCDAHGRTLNQGETKLTNPNFQFGMRSDTDRLFYDKALFRDWLRSEFSSFRK